MSTIMNDLTSGAISKYAPFRFPRPGGNSRITSDINNNILWIELKFKKYNEVTGNIWQDGGFGGKPEPGPTMMFIAPLELQETFTHSWEDSSNIAGRAVEQLKGLIHTTHQLGDVGEFLKKEAEYQQKSSPGEGTGDATLKNSLAEGKKDHENFAKKTNTGLNRLASNYSEKLFYKYDAPQQYKDSPKPVYNFIFSLADGGDPEYDISLPIQMLKYLSVPNKPDKEGSTEKDLILFEFPYVCEINTVYGHRTVPIINVKYAAITSLQVVYNGPFRNGIPSQAEISISLSSLMPVYRSTMGGQGSLTKPDLITISSTGSNNMDRDFLNEGGTY